MSKDVSATEKSTKCLTSRKFLPNVCEKGAAEGVTAVEVPEVYEEGTRLSPHKFDYDNGDAHHDANRLADRTVGLQ